MAVHGRAGKIDLGSCLCLGRLRESQASYPPAFASDVPFKTAKSQLVGQFEKEYLRALLERSGGNVSRAAREARIERAYLQRLIRKHGLNA